MSTKKKIKKFNLQEFVGKNRTEKKNLVPLFFLSLF